MSVIYKNDAIRINFNIGIATTDTSNIVLKYRKPVADYPTQFIEGEFTEVLISNVSNGDCYVEVDNNVMTPEGEWTFWSYITTIDTNEFSGEPFTQFIHLPGVNITNKDFVKSYLGITVDTNDNKIDALIPLYEQLYLQIRNAPWAQRYDETNGRLFNHYPPGANVTIAEMIGFALENIDTTLSSESTMNYKWTRDTNSMKYGFPSGIISQIKRFINGV